MKTFSEKINQKQNPFNGNDVHKRRLYNIISETLKVDKGEIEGVEKLVESVYSILEREQIKSKIKVFEKVINNPTIMITEEVTNKEYLTTEVDEDGELVVKLKNTLK